MVPVLDVGLGLEWVSSRSIRVCTNMVSGSKEREALRIKALVGLERATAEVHAHGWLPTSNAMTV